MGPGWRLNMLHRLRLNTDNTVTFSDASGAQHRFMNPQPTDNVTTYSRPNSAHSTPS
jgi:hypothetical protein